MPFKLKIEVVMKISEISILFLLSAFFTGTSLAETNKRVLAPPVLTSNVGEELPLMKMHVVRRRGKHPGYTVDIRYPRFMGGLQGATNELNREVVRILNTNVTPHPSPKCFTYHGNFKDYLITPSLVSVRFEFDGNSGGAQIQTIESDLNAQIYPQFRILKLKDLLGLKKIDYSKLSKLCITEIYGEVTKGDELAVKPEELSPACFTYFVFDRRGITFRLPEKILAPLSLNSPNLTISYKVLERSHLLSANSPVRKFAGQ